EYGDEKIPFAGTVGEKARAELFEYRYLLVGKEAPDIEGEDQDGQRFKLSDYRGTVVLLDFWNQYSLGGRAQSPRERSLVQNLKNRAFALIGVNVNGYDARKLKQVMETEKMSWRSFAGQGAIVGTWNLPGTPTFYVIDHQGVIRHKWVGSSADYQL